MLCASIFSEVVLGFMLWTGWLGSAQPMAYNEADCGCVPCCYCEPCPPAGCPGGTCPEAACPQTWRPCGMPVESPRGNGTTGNQMVVADIAVMAVPKHVPRCSANLPLSVNGVPSSNVFPCITTGKPCQCFLGARVAERYEEGVALEMSYEVTCAGKCETYKATQKVHFDTPTSVVLAGNYPEPVCAQVCVRRVQDLPALVWSAPPPRPEAIPYPVALCPQPLLPPAPALSVASPFPSLPMPIPVSQPMQIVRLPDPLPLPPPTPLTPTVYTMPVKKAPCAHIRLVYEAGKARLSVKSESLTTECMRMKLEAGQTGALRLSAGKNHVHIAGSKWKAQADRIDLGNDGQIVLTGHVKLSSDKLGVCAAVTADQMCVHVKAGKFEKIAEQK